MLSTERKLYLLQKVEREGTIHVRDVAKQLNISETTIRRDLMELEQEGKVRRVHGGAVREAESDSDGIQRAADAGSYADQF